MLTAWAGPALVGLGLTAAVILWHLPVPRRSDGGLATWPAWLVVAGGALIDVLVRTGWAVGVGGGLVVAGIALMGQVLPRRDETAAPVVAWPLLIAPLVASVAAMLPLVLWRGVVGLILLVVVVWIAQRTADSESRRLLALGLALLGLAAIGLMVGAVSPTLGGSLVGVIAVLMLGGASALAAATVVGPMTAAVSGLEARLGQLEDDHEHLLRLTDSDPLTGCPTRDALRAWFERWQGGSPVSVALIDIDSLKGINERHGHDAGDEALRLMAGVLSSSIRPGDLVVRWGGDEFVVVLRGAEHEAATRRLTGLMASLQEAASSFPYDTPLRVDWGVSSCTSPADISRALAEADQRMFAMKRRR